VLGEPGSGKSLTQVTAARFAKANPNSDCASTVVP
jgi:hypothetical protein